MGFTKTVSKIFGKEEDSTPDNLRNFFENSKSIPDSNSIGFSNKDISDAVSVKSFVSKLGFSVYCKTDHTKENAHFFSLVDPEKNELAKWSFDIDDNLFLETSESEDKLKKLSVHLNKELDLNLKMNDGLQPKASNENWGEYQLKDKDDNTNPASEFYGQPTLRNPAPLGEDQSVMNKTTEAARRKRVNKKIS